MKYIIFLYTTLLLFNTNSFAQDLNKLQQQDFNLAGKVTSFTETIYQNPMDDTEDWKDQPFRKEKNLFNSKGFIRKKENLTPNEKGGWMDYEYSKDGQLTEIEIFDGEGTSFGKLLVNRYDRNGQKIESYQELIRGSDTIIQDHKKWTYNKKGNRLSETILRDGKPALIYVYEYDTKGKKIKELRKLPDGTLDYETRYVYDKKGNKIEQSGYYNNQLNDQFRFTYDDQNRKIEEAHAGSDGVVYSKTVTTYDNQGNIIQEEEIKGDNDTGTKTIFEYDDHGNWIKEERFLSNGEPFMLYHARYQYDDHGNWVEKVVLEDGQEIEMYQRTITYE